MEIALKLRGVAIAALLASVSQITFAETNVFNTLLLQDAEPPAAEPAILEDVKEESNWKHTYTGGLQVSQSYISDNWYQGGESNFNLLNDQNYGVKFDNQKLLLFTTDVIWRLGLITSTSDTYHKIQVNDDLFQVTTKFGVKAAKNWYYTLAINFNTQLFNSFEANSNTLSSAPFSPGNLNIGLGMSYNYTNEAKKFETSVMLAPLAYNLKFSLDEDLAYANGIPLGELHLNQIGSSAEATFKWEFYKNLTWTGRGFYFTDYHRTLGELETGLNFAFNKYFSTRIYVQSRYDNSVVERSANGSFFQFKEVLSFGLNYTM